MLEEKTNIDFIGNLSDEQVAALANALKDRMKEAKKAEKEAEKEAKKAEREAEKEAKKAEREAERFALERERKQKVNDICKEVLNNPEFDSLCYNKKKKAIFWNNKKMTKSDIEFIQMICKQKGDEENVKISYQEIEFFIKLKANNNQISGEPQINNVEKSDWYGKLSFKEDGEPYQTLGNVVTFFRTYPKYVDKFRFNEFTQYESFDGQLIEDHHIPVFRLDLENQLGFDSKDKVETAVSILTHENSFNPFKEALEKIYWDGQERAESLFIDFLGVNNTKLNRSLTKKWLFAMIKRLYEPGCDFDNVLIIYDSTQGTGKSKLMKRLVYSLGVEYGYDTTITCDSNNKDNVDKLNKAWVVGFDEMAAFTKKETEQTKQFVSQSEETARLSYGRRSRVYKRHCVFYGNTNESFFLKDYTSSFERRYWVMDASGEKHSADWWRTNCSDEYLRQVLAEMKYIYDNEPDFDYTSLTLEEQNELEEVQYAHKTLQNDDILKDKILKLLDKTYSKSEFNDYDEWLKETRIEYIMPSIETQKFFGENQQDVVPGKLDRIPVQWLKQYVREEMNRPGITTQYITAMLKYKWEYKACKYNHMNTNCYKRM